MTWLVSGEGVFLRELNLVELREPSPQAEQGHPYIKWQQR